MVRRADDTDDSTGSPLLHLGKKGLGSTPSIFWPIRRHFLGAPECRQSPPTGGGATAVALHGTTHPRPCTKGGCGHRLCATWAAPRDGSNRRRASARCLAPHAPPFGRLRHKVGSCPPPNPRFIQSEGGGPGAVSSLFRNPLGGTGEGGRGGQIFRTPLLAPELSFWVAEAPGRQGPAPPAKPRLVRSEGGGHRSDGTSLSVTHRGGPARGGRGG